MIAQEKNDKRPDLADTPQSPTGTGNTAPVKTTLIPVLVTGIQQRRIYGAKEFLHAKDFAWLDPRHKGEDDGGWDSPSG
ncbi:hypothetical protein QM996_09395 [Sinorhizobium chiapasense]